MPFCCIKIFMINKGMVRTRSARSKKMPQRIIGFSSTKIQNLEGAYFALSKPIINCGKCNQLPDAQATSKITSSCVKPICDGRVLALVGGSPLLLLHVMLAGSRCSCLRGKFCLRCDAASFVGSESVCIFLYCASYRVLHAIQERCMLQMLF